MLMCPYLSRVYTRVEGEGCTCCRGHADSVFGGMLGWTWLTGDEHHAHRISDGYNGKVKVKSGSGHYSCSASYCFYSSASLTGSNSHNVFAPICPKKLAIFAPDRNGIRSREVAQLVAIINCPFETWV